MDRSEIFTRAWEIYHNERRHGRAISFGKCLKRSWTISRVKEENADLIRTAAAAAGVTEEFKTWYAWKEAGREVIHEQKALFQVKLIRQKDGKQYTASFFGISQTTDEPQEAKAA